MTKTKHIRKEFNSFEEFNKFISDLAEGKIDIEEMEKKFNNLVFCFLLDI